MIDIPIPGHDGLVLEHLVLDYNGTLAVDGDLADGVVERLRELSATIRIEVVTADTFGKAAAGLEGLPVELVVLPPGAQDEAKAKHVGDLGAERTVAIGNGRNDALMLREAALGIAVLLDEGASGVTLAAADVVCVGIASALDLLLRPKRLVATLRR